MKTYSPKPEHIVRHWYVVDASGQVLGRLASEVAALLRGKHKPIFAPHMDTGDHVIVVNAEKIELTGGKESKKISYRHSGYPGGIKGTRYDRLMAEKPTFVIEKAVRGMLPKNKLGRAMIKKLHVVAGPEHRHQAQQPTDYTLGQPPVWEGLPVRQPRVTKASKAASAPAAKPATEKPAAKPRATAKTTATSPAKKSAAKKTSASKSPAKKSTTAKTTARKTTTKKTAARKPVAKEDQGE